MQMEFDNYHRIGSVNLVDGQTISVVIDQAEDVRRISVNCLIAIECIPNSYIIGIVTRVSRKVAGSTNSLDQEHGDEFVESFQSEKNEAKVSLVGTFFNKMGLRANIFKRLAVSLPKIASDCFLIEGEILSLLMRSLVPSSESGTPAGLEIGSYFLDQNVPALIDADKFFQRHAMIIGSTGSGKSWATATIAEKIGSMQYGNAILLDLHGEYHSLVGSEITHLRVAGPDDIALDKGLSDGVLHLPSWLLSYDELEYVILQRSAKSAAKQAAALSSIVSEAKANGWKDLFPEESSTDRSLESPVAFDINSILSKIEEKADLKDAKDRINARISDTRFGFMFKGEAAKTSDYLEAIADTLIGSPVDSTHKRVKILNLSEVPIEILPTVIGLLGHLVFSIQYWSTSEARHPIVLICDEAHSYLSHQRNSDSSPDLANGTFERIAKEGRKYGISLLLVTQRPSELNKTVLSQCNNYIAMRLTNPDDQATIKNVLPSSFQSFAELLPLLDRGEAIVIGDASILPARVKISTPSCKPDSSSGRYWHHWTKEPAAVDLQAAISSWRLQRR